MMLYRSSRHCGAFAASRHVGRLSQFQQVAPRHRANVPVTGRILASNVRHATLEAGENKSGHIHTGPNEGVFFFDSVYPLRLKWIFRLPFIESRMENVAKAMERPALAGVNPRDVLSKVSLEKANVDITEILPRLKEGGAFVKFSHAEGVSLPQVEEAIQAYLKETRPRPWWNPFDRMRAKLVRGQPWVEDLYRLPSQRIKVEFVPSAPGDAAAELSEEQLYSFFRPYGKIADIIPQPTDSKAVPRFALVDFTQTRRAIMAKNCLHGYTVSEVEGGGKAGTVLRLSFEKRVKAHWIREWIFNHPRIVIPILIALAGVITVSVFDPVRTFFVKAHIQGTFHLSNNRVYRWLRSQTVDLFSSFRQKSTDDGSMDAIWVDRRENIEQIRTWLMETADTFIIVQGPRGSGKRELVLDQALKTRKHKIVIDCKPIQEARGDSPTICAAAAEVGYRPVFSWMNNISGMIDLAAQGAAGVKTGFSETLDSQLAKIWNNTATALKSIALEGRKKDDKDANLSDDEYLEAHPERRPVVVIDNFLHKAQESNVVYDKLAEWAARLTTANIAHVVFLTTDVSFSKSLSKALPDRVFRQISLGDCSPEAAKRYVINHLDADPADAEDSAEGGEKKLTPSQRREDLVELDDCISALGGRLTDLEFLARRIKTGETPKRAVDQIIEQSASEIMKMYLFGKDEARHWQSEQAWLLIRQLAERDSLRYNEVLLADAFKTNGDATLQALEQAELISIAAINGRPQAIKPGKPVFQRAFKLLTSDRVLKARLDLAILTEQIKGENASIDKYENELRLLGELPNQPPQLVNRIMWLLGKVQGSQDKIEGYERESAVLKKVLAEEF